MKYNNIKKILRKQVQNNVKTFWTYNEENKEFINIYKMYRDLQGARRAWFLKHGYSFKGELVAWRTRSKLWPEFSPPVSGFAGHSVFKLCSEYHKSSKDDWKKKYCWS